MRELARGKIPDETLAILWRNHLPPEVRAVLAATDSKDVGTLATVADKVIEATTRTHVAEVKVEDTSTSEIAALIAEVRKLTTRLDNAERSRSRSRDPDRRRFRQRSPWPSRSPANNGICYYHQRFRNKARNCESPCSWKNATGNEEQRSQGRMPAPFYQPAASKY